MTSSSFSYLLSPQKDDLNKDSLPFDWRILKNYFLNRQDLSGLASKLANQPEHFSNEVPLIHIRVCIISSGNSSLIVPSIVGSGLKYGLNISITDVSNTHPLLTKKIYNEIENKKFDVILIALNFDDVPFLEPTVEQDEKFKWRFEGILNQLKTLKSTLANTNGAQIVIQNIPRKPLNIFGDIDVTTSESLQYQQQLFNRKLSEITADSTGILFDVATIAEDVGLNHWYDERMWYLAKFTFAPDFLPHYADHFCRILNTIKGKSRKCLVLDLDNTLWGGIIGQDGLDGINLSMGDAVGEAFIAFQRYIMQLKNRGVILAVCSKNNEEDALGVFRDHPNMLLKLNDFACFVANWENKPTNIRTIAKTLNIGLDAIVFVDDTPLERENVRRFLPDVAVPEMPQDPALYVRAVSQAGYFDMLSYTKEDRNRTQSYQHKLKAEQAMSESINIQDALNSIAMEIRFKEFDPIGRKRIVQLINKSNQYNLTTKRYNEKEIESFEQDSLTYTLQVSLRDKFGDYGMISVLIGFQSDETLEIDTWLMSCRVIGRDVEKAVFQELIKYCKKSNIQYITGRYIKSDRNSLVKEHYSQLGFSQPDSNDESLWQFTLKKEQYEFEKLPFIITS